MRIVAIFMAALVLAGCGMTAKAPAPAAPDAGSGSAALPGQEAHALRPYPETDEFLQCVPFARTVSGVEIYGDAWTWWTQAEGRYRRGREPRIGAVLALRQTGRLRLGHVAVVVARIDERRLLVSHANWGGDSRTRGKIHTRQPVMDVSPANDWSQLRFMNTQGTFGSVYPAHGFIYPEQAVAALGR
ncbi:MAG: CHAP domain-containing protein [Oceanibaculum nanhaiense]|nr:CHAP domain-containing protein [Oceanibaculum nanhaiense]